MRTALALALVLVVGGAPACFGDGPDAGHGKTAQQPTSKARAPKKRQEPPLPSFSGRTLDGEAFEVSSLLGKRFLLYLFNPEVPEAKVTAPAIAAVAKLRQEHNFSVVGIGTGSKTSAVRSFAQSHGFDFPILDDSSAAIASRLAVRAPVAILGVDRDGYVTMGLAGFPTDGSADRAVEVQLREVLHLPPVAVDATPVLGEYPPAPGLKGIDILDGAPVDLAALRGRPVVLIFFLHTCPHCHHALEFFKEQLPKLPEATRPRLIGVSISDRAYAVEERLRSDGLAYFPVVLDPDQKIRNAYGVFAGIPDTFLIDAKGMVVARVQGWRDERDPPLMRMRLARLAGGPVPMLLHQTGYSGDEFCGVCHSEQAETWMLTRHASAYETLVKHGADRDADCVGCHVVGFGKEGGFSLERPSPHFEDVGCENCHGRGGPHLSPGFVENHDYEPACLTCHDTKHSLGFDYATFLPRVSHAANAGFLRLSLEEKREILAERGKPRSNLLPTSASFVGSDACRTCHAAEFATWEKSDHARATASLEKAGKASDSDCLRCHTTGFGGKGGFPDGTAAKASPDLGRVGCESCHGPGGEHVQAGVAKIGSIVSLGDKCDSCVILQICGGCHDDANDPGFAFEVLDKIEVIRHGTLEPGTGRPKGTQQGAAASRSPDQDG